VPIESSTARCRKPSLTIRLGQSYLQFGRFQSEGHTGPYHEILGKSVPIQDPGLPGLPTEYISELASDPCPIELPSAVIPLELHSRHSERGISEMPTEYNRVVSQALLQGRSDIPTMVPFDPTFGKEHEMDWKITENAEPHHRSISRMLTPGLEMEFLDYGDADSASSNGNVQPQIDPLATPCRLASLQTDHPMYALPSLSSEGHAGALSATQVSPVTPSQDIERYAIMERSGVSPIEGTMLSNPSNLHYGAQFLSESDVYRQGPEDYAFPQPEPLAKSSAAESFIDFGPMLENDPESTQRSTQLSWKLGLLDRPALYHEQAASDLQGSKYPNSAIEVPQRTGIRFGHHEGHPHWYLTPSQGSAAFGSGFENSSSRRNPELLHKSNGAGDSSRYSHNAYPTNERASVHRQPFDDRIAITQYSKRVCSFCNTAEFNGKYVQSSLQCCMSLKI
jgi:hypothetical protein